MKVRVYRTSNYPVHPIKLQAFKDECKSGYDAVEGELGKFCDEKHIEWQTKLKALDDHLIVKYPRFEDQEIRTVEEIEDKVKFYGTTLAFCLEKDPQTGTEIFTAYIMDNP